MKTNKKALKQIQEIDNQIANLESRIKALEWQRREIINHHNLNKPEQNTEE